ncbi:MAG TPA: xylose isomerase [Candidatus Latescibacteria bacterium]|nr:xylose isomerase [Candidatus Latescibacterota bacterium]|tara:strand:+ start:440 stop:1267 length:828 start_codon:yes stop_codon:yes gene_type:complete
MKLQYILASSLYGTLPLSEIIPEVKRAGSSHIDIWPRVHGDQREQIEAMGNDAFAALLEANDVQLGISTRFDLGPFELQQEMAFVSSHKGSLLVCGSKGSKDLQGDELRAAVADFAEALRPHIDAAGEHGVTIAIENHGNALIETPDSMKWLIEFTRSPHLGIALAPYHLPDDSTLVARLIEELGPGLALFYGWQHGMGCHEKLPKEQELMQLPGRGTLDFRPLLAALEKIDYRGWTEIFMHPVPRGIPILETAGQVTAELERARVYLDDLVQDL